MVILGAGPTGKLLAANIRLNNPYGLRVVGFLDDRLSEGTLVFGGLKVLGKVSSVAQVVEGLGISEVLVCLDDVPHKQLQDVLDVCMKTPAQVKVASPLYDVIAERMFTERYGKVPVVGITSSSSIAQTLLKRLVDLLLAAMGLMLLFPLFALIGLAIKLDSPGEIFFKQIRIGKGGKRFVFYKFRSMIVGSDNDDIRRHQAVSFIKAREANGNGSASTKIVNESRVTRVGKVLRKTSFDELPQLINVIRGEMSLVGPRPCLPYEWENYDEWHKKRLSVTPGCTGVWQVSGRGEVGFDDMVVLDLYYIQNTSLLLDFQLILKTIPVMLFAKGAK
jgi:exopolysaccharide biosynthesis polyprenyl glycosylphosphotransferase